MNITQQLCCPGAAENQDYIRLGENIAMVVDGSTPLVKDPRVPEVREYVRLLADAVVGAEAEARRPVARCRLRNPRKDPNYLGPCPYGTLLPST